MTLSWGKAVKINSAPFVLPPSKSRPAPLPASVASIQLPVAPVKAVRGTSSTPTPLTPEQLSLPPPPAHVVNGTSVITGGKGTLGNHITSHHTTPHHIVISLQ